MTPPGPGLEPQTLSTRGRHLNYKSLASVYGEGVALLLPPSPFSGVMLLKISESDSVVEKKVLP